MQRVIAHKETEYIQDCEEGVVIQNNIEISNINTVAKIIGYVATEFEEPIEVIPVENVAYNIEITVDNQNELNIHEENYLKNRLFICMIFFSVILIIAIRNQSNIN
jgi:hypothetical protein